MPSLYRRFLLALSASLLAHFVAFILVRGIIDPQQLSKSSRPAYFDPLQVDFRPRLPEQQSSPPGPEDVAINKTRTTESSESPTATKAISKNEASAQSTPQPEAKFYTLKELDQPPVLENKLNLNPLTLQQSGATGMLNLRLWIDQLGNVVQTEVIETTLPESFVEVAVQNFKQAKFQPGLIAGEAVSSKIKIVVHYDPPSTSPIPSGPQQAQPPINTTAP